MGIEVVDRSERIRKIVLKNDDDTEEVLEKGMVVRLSKVTNEERVLSFMICNLNFEEVDTIFQGLKTMIKEME